MRCFCMFICKSIPVCWLSRICEQEMGCRMQTFPFVLQGSLVALSNVQNVRGTGNRISNRARYGYQAATP